MEKSKLKPISELSIEELLKIAETSQFSPLIYKSKTDVIEFISFYQLKLGDNKVTSALLYNLYRRWSNNPIPRQSFTKEVTELFPVTRWGIGYLFGLNKSKEELLNTKAEFNKKKLKTKSPKYAKHFQNYLKHFNIKSGSFYVKDVVLYNLYDKWRQYKRHLFSLEQFIPFCKIFFKYKKIKGNYYFAVDKEIKSQLSENLLKLNEEKNTSKFSKISRS